MRFYFITAVMLMFSFSGFSQIEGKWKTIDDETNKAKSIVEIWKDSNGLYYGKVIKIFDESKVDDLCTECDKSDARYNQKILGMTVISDMKKTDDNEWEKGTILDPNNGKVYDCKIFREGENLMVRGYLLFFYRTQKWLPVSE